MFYEQHPNVVRSGRFSYEITRGARNVDLDTKRY